MLMAPKPDNVPEPVRSRSGDCQWSSSRSGGALTWQETGRTTNTLSCMDAWQEEQQRLERLIVDDERLRPPVAGKFRDGRPQAHPWLRVFQTGHDPATGERYYLLQTGGSGASWWKASEIDLFPDEPSP